MSEAAPTDNATKSMDDIMALCKRRGFIYQASEIYGGINGFWDYGPLGAQLKKNLRDAWWQDVVMNPCAGRPGPNGEPVSIVPVDTCIIQNPKVWEASGHTAGFNDMTTDCRSCKTRPRADHLMVLHLHPESVGKDLYFSGMGTLADVRAANAKKLKNFGDEHVKFVSYQDLDAAERPLVPCHNCGEVGTLTEPRPFNLMFSTTVGALGDPEKDKAYLRPETAQGIFINFKNVIDTMRIKLPFGIAQTGKAFRNEVTPRNFTFRSREFEQMEIEFFCHPDEAEAWYAFWRDWRMDWWQSLGLAGDNLILREHDKDELAHYAKEGAGTSDVEYRFPFTAPGYGELEGVAHRTDFDLRQHQDHSKIKMDYFDQELQVRLQNEGVAKDEIKERSRYIPHCIEPSAGLDRGVLAVLCEAYTRDESRPSPELLRIHPRLAPIKAAVFPLVNKDGMPEIAQKLHADLVKRFGRLGGIEFDAKQSIGKRYARMDEAGAPCCFTIDGETKDNQTVTARDRDTGAQERIALDKVSDWLADKLGV